MTHPQFKKWTIFVIYLLLAVFSALVAFSVNQLPGIPKAIPTGLRWFFAIAMAGIFGYLSYLAAIYQPDNPEREEAIRKKLVKALISQFKERWKGAIDLDRYQSGQLQPKGNIVNRMWENVKTGRLMLLSPDRSILEVFENEKTQRLVILGEPGSGKTTELLNLANALIEKADADKKEPVPVIFELSNWRPPQTIAKWLIEELYDRYGLDREIGDRWLKQDRFIPLLDGLDELKALKEDCIQAINQFQEDRQYQQLALAICCRVKDYESCKTELDIKEKLCLQDWQNEQIRDYLDSRNASHIWQAIQGDPQGFLALARKPLLLNLLPEAYPRTLKTEKKRFWDNEKQEEYYNQCLTKLFDDYLSEKLDTPHDNRGYSAAETRRYLRWLAKTLKRQGMTEFAIEHMQPSWLETEKQRRSYRLIGGLILGLILGFTFGLVYGLMLGFIVGLVQGLIFGFIFGLVFEVAFDSADIQLVEKLDFSWSAIRFKLPQEIIRSLIAGLIFGLIIGIAFWFIHGPIGLVVGLIIGLTIGLLIGMIIGLILSLRTEIKVRTQPNQGIWRSQKKAVLIWLLSSLPIMSILTLPIWFFGQGERLLNFMIAGFLLSMAFCLVGGGIACIQHFVLRSTLKKSGNIPQNYADFLDYAQERKIIKITGGYYRFYHDLLRENLAGGERFLSEKNRTQINNKLGFIRRILASGLFIVILISVSTMTSFQNSAAAMSPLIQTNDVMLCDRIFYRLRLRPIERGDIAIFATQEGFEQQEFPNQFATRRIIALPNETIEIAQGKVYINGNVRDEDYISLPENYQQERLQLPGDAYYFIGNNPDYGDRDLFGGIVPRKNIRGEVLFRITPLNRFGLIE
ncbi:MAG: signal peptidase I [Cyanobacteria bacterium P01_E01_bin.42]